MGSNTNLQSLLNQSGNQRIIFGGIPCRKVEPENPRSEWAIELGPLDRPKDYRIFQGTPAQFFERAAAQLAEHDLEALTEPEVRLHYVAMAYPGVEAAQDALRELVVREPLDLKARQAYWETMRDQAEVIYEFLGLV